MEVCALDFAGGGSDVISGFAFQAGGVGCMIRRAKKLKLLVNRQTQNLEPGLAISWKVSKDGRQISFRLRSGISFSDGTPFSAEDVAYTIQQLMDPALHSPTGDAFR